MKRHFLALLPLVALAICPSIHSQTPSGDVPLNCDNSISAGSEDCMQRESGFQQDNQGVGPYNSLTNSPYNTTAPGDERSTTSGTRAAERVSSPTESEAISGTSRRLSQSQQNLLPPDLPTEFQKFVAATIGQVLPIYGENLFRNVPSTFSPSNLTPVTPDYVIGPDDELRVRIWGQITYTGNLRVDRSGNIYLPQAGSVHVAGLQYSALDQHLRAAVGRMYRNFDLSVDVGRIRSMQIYVTGQARRPGVYTVSSLTSLVDALFASGGPTPQGSLRNIQVNREGKLVGSFDLYALLLRGDKSKDIRLLPEDVLYIPPSGPQVAISGSVRTPGIFELRDGETIADLIEAAGKTTAMSSAARISLERTGQDQLREAMEFKFAAQDLATRLTDGDILRIYPILPAYQKTVTLRGNVANPGRFSLRPGMHLSDLIPDRDSLVSRDYWWKRSHLGLPVPEFEPLISTIGRDQRTPESTRQGFTGSVSQETLTSALTAAPRSEQSADAEAASSGTVASQLAQRQSQQQGQQSFQQQGQQSFQQQGQQPFLQQAQQPPKRNEVRLLSPGINWAYAVIERVDPETLKTSLIPFDLGKLVLEHDATQDLALQAGDAITIFSESDIQVPIQKQTKYVELAGEFAHGGVYSVQPGETLRDLVRRAGGLTQNAYLYGSEFTRESTRVLQQQRLDEYVRNVNAEAQRGTQALAVSGSAANAVDVTASRAAAQELVARLSQIRATGRIVLKLKPTNVGIDDIPAISLENGDRFVVPFAPATVNVVGAVYDQSSFLFEPGRSTKHYLSLAGGPNRNADRSRAFVIRADGSVISRGTSGSFGFSGNSFNDLRLNPGDTIVMPDKVLRPTALRNVLDWTQVFSQLALGAAAINVL